MENKKRETVIGVCVKCGKKYDVPAEAPENNGEWRFNCEECGSYRIFINEDITTEIVGKDTIHRCGTCGEVIERGGEGDAAGYGLDIHQCTNDKCKRMYYAIWY